MICALQLSTNEAEYSFRETGRESYGFGQESGIATNEQTNDSRQLYALLAESRRLTTENAALRHCLILTKEHSDLKSANYIASAMTWCDDNLRKYTTGKDTNVLYVYVWMCMWAGAGSTPEREGERNFASMEQILSFEWESNHRSLGVFPAEFPFPLSFICAY